MPVILQSGYTLPGGAQSLDNARILHARNWLSGGTAVASTTAAGYFADGPKTSLTYEKWKPTTLTATWEYNHGSSQSVDCCAIGAHNLGTSGNTVTVERWTGSAWAAMSPATLFTSDQAALFIFTPTSAQRWRISITGGVAPEIGVIKFGTMLQMERPIWGGHSPLELARQPEMRATISESGEFLGRTRQRVQHAGSFAWEHLTAAWVRSNWPNFQKAIESEPFFIAWRPADYGDCALCQADEVPVPQNMGIRDLMAVDLSVRALAYD